MDEHTHQHILDDITHETEEQIVTMRAANPSRWATSKPQREPHRAQLVQNYLLLRILAILQDDATYAHERDARYEVEQEEWRDEIRAEDARWKQEQRDLNAATQALNALNFETQVTMHREIEDRKLKLQERMLKWERQLYRENSTALQGMLERVIRERVDGMFGTQPLEEQPQTALTLSGDVQATATGWGEITANGTAFSEKVTITHTAEVKE